MRSFFNPNELDQVIIPIYGRVHMLSLLLMLILVLILFWRREAVRKLASNRRFMVWLVVVFLIQEAIHNYNLWAYPYESFIDRFPGHLCGILSLLIPFLLLTEKYNSLRFIGYWAIGAGFIAFVNPSYLHYEVKSWMFLQYHLRHLFLLLLPLFLQIGRSYSHSYREFMLSIATLSGYAFLIFLLDWATGANFMHLGPNNTTAIPFLPGRLAEWPFTLPSFIVVGTALLHLVFLGVRAMGRKMPQNFIS